MLSPEALPGGEVGASGLMFWIARAGGKRSLSEEQNEGKRLGFRIFSKKIAASAKSPERPQALDATAAPPAGC